MNALVEILKIIIPAGAVFAAAYFLVKRFLDNDQKRREHELKKSALGTITPLKIQALNELLFFRTH
jgi:NADH:ubiquinone oxidoreductase subunit 6 (subunit J)